MLDFVLFSALGLVVGTLGTIVGVGGGFLLVPILLWLYPTQRPEILAGVSLAAVFFNALSGSIVYAKLKRIEYKSGLMFSLAALPGTILGSLSTSYIPRQLFDAVVGLALFGASIILLLHPNREERRKIATRKGHTTVTLTDASGIEHHFSYNLKIGLGLSFFVGYFSSLLGIGGGIIHVPALVQLLSFPVHIATATSHFILAIMAFTGSTTHLFLGTLAGTFGLIIPISIGVVLGAQIGARLSGRVRGPWIVRGLAVALMSVALRILWQLLR